MAAATSPAVPKKVVRFGVFGGTGVYHIEGAVDVERVTIDTPYGKPSDEITLATVNGVRCAFLPRHHHDHLYSPSDLNYRANVYAFKMLGVEYVLAVTAVGSLREDLLPGQLVLPTQLVDKTYLRQSTFFGNGVVCHAPFGHPICEHFRRVALDAIRKALPHVVVHDRPATLVTMEGPLFSTKSESLLNRQAGGDLIGMTTATEAKLCREAEMAYCCVSMVTDMDAWSDAPHVDVKQVMSVLAANAANALSFIKAVVTAIGETADSLPRSEAFDAMKYSLTTKRHAISDARLAEVELLIGKYL